MSRPSHSNEPASLQSLLKKANSIKILNEDNLAYIESKRGPRFINHRQYSSQPKPSSISSLLSSSSSSSSSSALISTESTSTELERIALPKKSKISHDSDIIDADNALNFLLTVKKNDYRDLEDILASWTYNGEELRKEKIAFDDFIDRTLERYNDLWRLHRKYEALLNKYSQVLNDQFESRHATEVLLHNMELLQAAIGEVYVATIDMIDRSEMDNTILSFMEEMSHEIKNLQSEAPELELQYDFQASSLGDTKENNILKFDEWDKMEYKYTLSHHEAEVCALEPYVIDGKQYLASAGFDHEIKLCDLSSRAVTATLTGHRSAIFSLVSFESNGVPILASGSWDWTIKLWDLSNNHCIHTLTGHFEGINTLAKYEKNDKVILISGSKDYSIKLWDMDKYSLITSLRGHRGSVRSLCVYYDEGRPYLASGSCDSTIKIWGLNSNRLIRTLDDGMIRIWSLVIMDHDDEKLLVSADSKGTIKLWNLKKYKCIATYDPYENPLKHIVLKDQRVSLETPGNNTLITSIRTDLSSNGMKAFINGDQSCLVVGYGNGDIKLWMN